jgi:hypothetical protein
VTFFSSWFTCCSFLKRASEPVSSHHQRRRSWGLDPARTHAAEEARCAPRLRPSLRYPFPTPLAGVRGLCLYGTCFPTAASEQREGQTVDTPLNNARACTYRENLNWQSQAHRGSRKSSCPWCRRKMPTGTEPIARWSEFTWWGFRGEKVE